MLLEIILAALLIMLASLSGVLLAGRYTSKFLHSHLSYFVSFTAGVFLVTALTLGIEAFELLQIELAIGFLALGYLLAWGMKKILPETHHHHDETCHRSHSGACRLIVGDSIHNVVDGMILVPAFLVSPVLGVAVTASILVHEALQEMSEFIVLKQAGFSTKRALLINFFVSSTIVLGIAISYFLLATVTFQGVLLAVAAGFFTHVVVHDLLPHRRVAQTKRLLLPHVLFVAVGVMLMGTVNTYLRDVHVHADGAAHEHDEEETHEHDAAVDNDHDAEDHDHDLEAEVHQEGYDHEIEVHYHEHEREAHIRP